MNKFIVPFLVVLVLIAICFSKADAVDQRKFQTSEYLTIRWAGRENTHIIRPSGDVEFLRTLFQQVKSPERVDERAFYMNLALNTLAREGYELTAMTTDEMVLRRPVTR